MNRSCLFACLFALVLGPPAASAQTTSKRDACKASVSAQGLRGSDKYDAWLICMAEGRLECTRQAVAQKLPREDTKRFIKTCVGTKAESKQNEKQDDKQDDQSD